MRLRRVIAVPAASGHRPRSSSPSRPPRNSSSANTRGRRPRPVLEFLRPGHSQALGRGNAHDVRPGRGGGHGQSRSPPRPASFHHGRQRLSSIDGIFEIRPGQYGRHPHRRECQAHRRRSRRFRSVRPARRLDDRFECLCRGVLPPAGSLRPVDLQRYPVLRSRLGP